MNRYQRNRETTNKQCASHSVSYWVRKERRQTINFVRDTCLRLNDIDKIIETANCQLTTTRRAWPID